MNCMGSVIIREKAWRLMKQTEMQSKMTLTMTSSLGLQDHVS